MSSTGKDKLLILLGSQPVLLELTHHGGAPKSLRTYLVPSVFGRSVDSKVLLGIEPMHIRTLYDGVFKAMRRSLASAKNGKCHCKHVFAGKLGETQSNYPLTLDLDGYNAALLMRPLI